MGMPWELKVRGCNCRPSLDVNFELALLGKMGLLVTSLRPWLTRNERESGVF